MLDYRLITFLSLCQTKNYTKTASLLHITQPAVTGHIKYLEEHYQVKLFTYANKTLELTLAGTALYELTCSLKSDIDKELLRIKNEGKLQRKLHFGATLTLGGYVLPPLLPLYLELYPEAQIEMHVDNTQSLLQLLKEGHLDFAFIEGHFHKADFVSRKLCDEPFIAIASAAHPLAHQKVSFSTLFKERLILREAGSGSRDIFEKGLYEQNMSLSSFSGVIELQNIQAIKTLIKANCGITFIYKAAVQEELHQNLFAPIYIEDFHLSGGFYFICRKNTLYQTAYLETYDFFKMKFLRQNRK